jgi:NAD(P)-dependent dehydrogenase (short-subunit alcohol dehydrogenase family)
VKTVVIQGGTDGIGREVGLIHLRRGDTVLVVGRTPAKGEAFACAAAEAGAADRAFFLTGDLSLIGENRRIVDEIRSRFPVVDILVMCARHCLSTRRETPDGLEETFALFYLSRFLFSHGLVDRLERAADPIMFNVAGPGDGRPVRWNDLQYTRDYHGVAALGYNARLVDLLAVSCAERYAPAGIRQVMFHPGVVSTSFSGEYDEVTAAQVAALKVTGKSLAQSIGQMLPCLDNPPPEPLTAFVEGHRIALHPALFDPGDAKRLHDITEQILAR